MPLEKRFGKRLQRASAQGESDAETPPQKKGRPIGQHQGSYRPKPSPSRNAAGVQLSCFVWHKISVR